MEFTTSPSGVRLANDFRDNLIIDRYHVDLATARGAKLEAMRSENSEDVVTWNVFRSLAQVDPAFWLPKLRGTVYGDAHAAGPAPRTVSVRLWVPVVPPPGLRSVQRDEGPSEVDIVIETEFSVWFIEAKFRSDVSVATKNNPDRDQVLRNIDVGSWYAGVRDFYFSLLIADAARSPRGVDLVAKYAAQPPDLPHRPDGLRNLRGVALMTWPQLARTIEACEADAPRHDERPVAARALAWMRERRLA